MRNIIITKVNYLKRKFKTSDPFELCDYLHIKIFKEDLGDNINGFFQSAPRNRIIHINSRLKENEQRITCAHELGHAIFHYKQNVLFLEKNTFLCVNKFEKEADTFAAELLITDELLLQYENCNIDFISNCEGISSKYIRLKFKEYLKEG